MKTEDALIEMLKENTGRHMLDSGGAYGRHWERNQERDFKSEPYGSVKASIYRDKELEFDITVNVFHWLKDRLEYDPVMDKFFEKWAMSQKYEDESWMKCMEDFVYKRLPKIGDLGGINGVASDEPFIVNTYNEEAGGYLSQILQYAYFAFEPHNSESKFEPGYRVLLQIHNGCDIRGGYTRPRVFFLSGYDETAILDICRCTVRCTESDKYNYHFPKNLFGEIAPDHMWYCDYFRFEETFDKTIRPLDQYDFLREETDDDIEQRGKDGLIHVDGDNNDVYCPICGGKLEAY